MIFLIVSAFEWQLYFFRGMPTTVTSAFDFDLIDAFDFQNKVCQGVRT